MTKEELKEELRLLDEIFWAEKKSIYKKYALSNNPYQIGDTITDHVATIKIQRIGIHISEGESQCVYTGIQYNKDGSISKKQDHATIYQSNIKN